MFTDTHAHLGWPDFHADLPAVIDRAMAAGVTRMVSIGTDLATSRQTLDIADRFAGVFAAVGLHPGDVPQVGLAQMAELRELARHAKVVAIGETGLDYYREAKHDPALRQQQKDLFGAHLALAKELRLPVIIHNREAHADLLEILRGHEPGFRPWGVMHCFSGDEKFAFDCIEIGLLVSYAGVLTFKNAAPLRAVAKAVPLEHVLLETDCPYLAPAPHRGHRNEPAYVPLTAAVLAGVKGVPVEEVAAVTTANAARLFRLS